MCGINGIIITGSFDSDKVKKNINLMNDSILHRGPDEDGVFIISMNDYCCSMAMRRLSIIDLHTGSQPIFSKDKNLVIVFNGEIYNYSTLKKKLLDDGVVFFTNSDTEVILKLYELYGESSFAMLDGMFAFSIYDKSKNLIFIARDFFGEKPLYYYNTKDGLIWASELKSITKILSNKLEIDSSSLSLYFQLTYIPAPFTIYKDIRKLEANHYIKFDCSTKVLSIHKILSEQKNITIESKNDAILHTRNLVNQSVLSRSISDVPLGTFLSGGVDSSIVSFCLSKQQSNKIDTFSVGFENKSFDESEKSRLVSKVINSNHHEFIINEKDLTDNIDEIILNFDEPFADSSALATYLVSKKTKNFVKVALTGDGGDEVFGGYNKYYMGKINQKYTSIVPEIFHINSLKLIEKIIATKEDSRGIRFKIKKLFSSINYKNDFYYNIISLGFKETETHSLFNSDFNYLNGLQYFKDKFQTNNNSILNFRAIDKEISLEGDMLTKVDRTSMLASLECRAPFLNKELWDFTNQLPDSYLINGWDKKHILKEAFKEFFPKDFLNKSKKGFGVPVGDWLRSDLRLELLKYIDKSFIMKQNIFNYEVVLNLIMEHLDSKVDNTFKVWTYYCFQKWYTNIYIKE
jgi:asparagine synthase (glutamine-hydrolysing)